MTVHVIRTDGTEEHHEVRGFRQIAPLIGAVTLDTVNLRDGRVLLVDDDGYETRTVQHPPGADGGFRVELQPVRPRKPVNQKATALYHAVCRQGTTHQIVGDVAIVRDEDLR